MRVTIPEVRAGDALAAMEEGSLDGDDQSEFGDAAVFRHGAPDIGVANDHGPAGDAQRLSPARHEEDQADTRILQHIVKRIHPPVAAAIRNRERGIVEASDESGAISLGRQIDHAKRIGRTDHDEGRRRYKLPTMPVEPRQDLAGEPSVGGPDDLPQILRGGDDLIEPRIARQGSCVHVPALYRWRHRSAGLTPATT